MSEGHGSEPREGGGCELHFAAPGRAAAITLIADLREAGMTIDRRSPVQVAPMALWLVHAMHDQHWVGDPQQVAAMEQIAARHDCDFRGWLLRERDDALDPAASLTGRSALQG